MIARRDFAAAFERIIEADTALREWQTEERAKAAKLSAELEPLMRQLRELVEQERAERSVTL